MSLSLSRAPRASSRGRQNLCIILPLLAVLVARVVLAPMPGSAWMLAAGTLTIMAGLVIRVLARQWKAERCASGLVQNGLYACVRHPLYLGSFLLGTGLCLVLADPLFFAAFLLLFWISHGLVIRAEEEGLERLFGEEYRAYRRRVPGLLPRRWPRTPVVPARLGEALVRECDSVCGWLALPVVIHLARWLGHHPVQFRPTAGEWMLLITALALLLALSAAWARMKTACSSLIRASASRP